MVAAMTTPPTLSSFASSDIDRTNSRPRSGSADGMVLTSRPGSAPTLRSAPKASSDKQVRASPPTIAQKTTSTTAPAPLANKSSSAPGTPTVTARSAKGRQQGVASLPSGSKLAPVHGWATKVFDLSFHESQHKVSTVGDLRKAIMMLKDPDIVAAAAQQPDGYWQLLRLRDTTGATKLDLTNDLLSLSEAGVGYRCLLEVKYPVNFGALAGTSPSTGTGRPRSVPTTPRVRTRSGGASVLSPNAPIALPPSGSVSVATVPPQIPTVAADHDRTSAVASQQALPEAIAGAAGAGSAAEAASDMQPKTPPSVDSAHPDDSGEVAPSHMMMTWRHCYFG